MDIEWLWETLKTQETEFRETLADIRADQEYWGREFKTLEKDVENMRITVELMLDKLRARCIV